MRISVCQTNIGWEDKDRNLSAAKEKIRAAKEGGSDLVLFPEMSFTGFSMHIDKIGETQGTTVAEMAKQAVKHRLSIGFGWVKKQKEKAENHYTIVDGSGKTILDYIKIHPFSYAGENRFFTGGETIVSCKIKEFQVSTFICYDLRFPEEFRLAAPNVSLILVPANWPKARAEHWKCLLQARAIENQVYIAGINCIGTIKGLEYSGDSRIIDPNGRVIGSIEEEGILTADLNNDVEEIRSAFPVLSDRKMTGFREGGVSCSLKS